MKKCANCSHPSLHLSSPANAVDLEDITSPSESRPRASLSTARRLCSGLTACRGWSRREGALTAMLYAFDLIEHDGEDPQSPVPRSQGRAGAPVAQSEAGILSMNTLPRTALSSPRTPAGLAQRASFQSGWTSHIDPVGAASGSRFATQQVLRCAARSQRQLERVNTHRLSALSQHRLGEFCLEVDQSCGTNSRGRRLARCSKPSAYIWVHQPQCQRHRRAATDPPRTRFK
jgi:hypothetical protein